MKKIRINELARELEVKPGVILDLLPELGVQEKKTHSSSVDEDVAIALRDRLATSGIPRNGSAGAHDNEEETATHMKEAPEAPHGLADTRSATSTQGGEPPRTLRPPIQATPVRPPAPAAASEPKQDEAPASPAPQTSAVAQAAAGAPAQPAPQQTPAQEKPSIPKFQPLRPPIGLGGGAPPRPPLAQAPIARSIPIPSGPARPPVAPAVPRPPAAPAVPASGPRQPLPAEPARPTLGTPALGTPVRPAPGGPVTPAVPAAPSASATPAAPTAPAAPTVASPSAPTAPAPGAPAAASPQMPAPAAPRPPAPPTHIIAPGPGAPSSQPSAVPGAPIPPSRPLAPRPQAAAPGSPRPAGPGLTPGAPIAPRPAGPRPPLAGQPAARPTVPPRPDILKRLQQQQTPQAPRPGVVPAGPARPAAPGRPAPPPNRPMYGGPVRPGQPQMRGPGGPGMPGQPGQMRGGRPGVGRPMHPTTPLRAESATPIPTDTRRHQAKPGSRQGPRKREEEGNLHLRGPKRAAYIEPPPIDREITVAEGVTVKELSEKLGVKANLVIKKLVETKKIFATINQTLDVKLAEELAREFGASTNQVSYEEESIQDIEVAEIAEDKVRRAPVVTIMGHVDHGKTSLLDAIRETNVAGREAGGITQHIGAYHIEKNGRKIVFIDTPGHQAFTRMRARGAKVTDIVILVVSADDGVMPQTLEAIDHARAAGVPIVVAINKIDKPDAQPDRVKQQLADRGLLAEDWGGDVVMVPVSAKKAQNLDLLLEMILLVADIQDLRATPGRPAIATVLEAKLDKGRGPVATVLVRNGTLRTGDFFICGALFGKVRAMFDDRGNPSKEAEPSMPVEVIGFDALPEVGDTFQVVSDTSKAKQIVIYREAKARDAAMAKGARVATLASLNQQFREGDLKDLNLIIKADVGGTAEVLSDTLTALSNEKVRVRVLRSGVGAVTEDDVLLASASEALIVGFNVRPERNAQSVAEQQKIQIRMHSIIYELIDDVKMAMTGMLEPVYKETIQGHAEVRETFKISKIGTIAGCYVSDGLIRRDSQVRVTRGGELIHTGRMESLKRFKNDASEVKNGLECGISLVNFNDIHVGDVIEAFAMERVAQEVPVG